MIYQKGFFVSHGIQAFVLSLSPRFLMSTIAKFLGESE